MNKTAMVAGALALALCGTFAGNAAAQTPPDAIYTFRYNHIANGQYFTYFDFSASSTQAGHLNFKTWTSPDTGSQVKFVDMKQYTNGVSKCLEYTFSPVGGRVYDYKIWANIGSANAPNWTKVSDDSGFNGGLYPRARVWISGSVNDSPTALRIAAYDSGASSSGDFFLLVLDTGYSRATCLNAPSDTGVVTLENGIVTVTKVGP
ncbi:MAG TPA: hypothetical protein VHB79_28115 [Polyangiaceae bacterium]|nr:hypothetical protein [Polyangiaceae bacterium]